MSAVFADVAPVRGHRDMLRYWKELRHTWGGGMRLDPMDVLDVGAGCYVVDLRLSGKGTRSGVEVDQRFAFLYTLRGGDGKVTSARLFPDLAAAVSATESSASQTA